MAEFYFGHANYRAAESRFREALQLNPTDTKAMFELAECLEKMNRHDEAIQEYRTCVQLEPNGAYAAQARKAIQRLSASNT